MKFLLFYFLFVTTYQKVFAELDGCPLGIRSGFITNDQMKASSYAKKAQPYYGRLDNVPERKSIGCWKPKKSVVREGIRVELSSATNVTGVVIQGRPGFRKVEYITSFLFWFGDTLPTMKLVSNEEHKPIVFKVERNVNGYATIRFPKTLTAKIFAIRPVTWVGAIAVRFELLTC